MCLFLTSFNRPSCLLWVLYAICWSCDTLKHEHRGFPRWPHRQAPQDPGLTTYAAGLEGLNKALSKQRMSEIGACPRPSPVEGT